MDEEQKTTEELDAEIEKELKSDEQEQRKELEEQMKKTGRKPYRISDFDAPRDREMAVFTHAKKLSEYLFIITEKSPVKYRWSIVTRLLNTSTDIIEYLYRANYEREKAARIEWQKKSDGVAEPIGFLYRNGSCEVCDYQSSNGNNRAAII